MTSSISESFIQARLIRVLLVSILSLSFSETAYSQYTPDDIAVLWRANDAPLVRAVLECNVTRHSQNSDDNSESQLKSVDRMVRVEDGYELTGEVTVWERQKGMARILFDDNGIVRKSTSLQGMTNDQASMSNKSRKRYFYWSLEFGHWSFSLCTGTTLQFS